MVEIGATPAMAATSHGQMAGNPEVVRRRVGQLLTLADKVLLGHLDGPDSQDLEPGRGAFFNPARPRRVPGRVWPTRPVAVHANTPKTRRGSRHDRSRSTDPGRDVLSGEVSSDIAGSTPLFASTAGAIACPIF